MSLLFSAFQLVLKRSLSNWKLLSCVIVGVLVAVALVSSTPLYSNTLGDLGLSRALHDRQIELIDLHVYAPNYDITLETYERDRDFVSQTIRRNLGSVIAQEEYYIRTQTFYAGWADRPVPTGDSRPKGHFQVVSNLEKHVHLIKGRYPEPFPSDLEDEELLRPGLEVEALIGTDTASTFGVDVGDRLVFIYGWGTLPATITIRLTGIIEPIDPTEEFWFLKTDVFFLPERGEDEGPTAPLFIPEQTLFQGVGRIAPQSKATYNWYYYTDISAINTENATAVKNAVDAAESQLIAELPRTSVFTQLSGAISQFEQKLLYTQIPLFLLIFQIVAIVLYYVVTVANMVIDRQAGEIALLRSRGASTWQILVVYIMEGLIITILGGVAGPFLGAVIFAFLGTTTPFLPLTGGGFLEVRLSSAVFILAGAAAVLCLFALLVPAVRAARVGMVHQRQQAGRPARAPFWQRYYLDLILLVIGGGLYYELRERGSLVNRDMFGGVEVDPLLLITPILFMIAAAIVFLRLFPLIIRIVSRLSRYATNASLVLSLRYMARNPVHYGRLILLLMMAASVGMFSASFLGTLQRSYEDRALYQAGSDVRLEGIYDERSSKQVLIDKYSEVPGLEDISIGYRGDGVMGSLFTQVGFEMLAVDPSTFADVFWYRDDFSNESLSDIMALLEEDQPRDGGGLQLPEGTEAIGVWAYPTDPTPQLTLMVRIRDARGRFVDYELGMPGVQNWQYLEVDLHRPGLGSLPPGPLTVQAIYARLKGASGFSSRPPTTLYLDNLQVTGSFADAIVVDDFERPTNWIAVAEEAAGGSAAGMPTTNDTITASTEIVHDGQSSARFSWQPRRTFGNRGMYPNLDVRPMMVVASQSLLDRTGISVGSKVTIRLPGQFIPVEIVGVVDYFPTVDPDKKGLALVNIDRLVGIRNVALSGNVRFYPNEVFLTVTEDKEQRAEALAMLNGGRFRSRELIDQTAMIDKSRADPLVAAGWGGILLIAFLGVIIVSGLGFVVYAYLSAQSRQLEFAILRTLGFSLRQIIVLICLEQLFVIGSGMGIGTVLGMQLSGVMMPFLQLTEMGVRVLPPFVPVTDWMTIGIAYMILTVAFVTTISLVVLYFSRIAIHRALRIGDV